VDSTGTISKEAAPAQLASSARQTPEDVVSMLSERAARAHEVLMRGDIDLYRETIELAPDFLLMDPLGGKPTGVPGSDEHWQRIGALFRDGRNATFDLIRAYATDDMVVLVANEHAHVAFGSLPAQPWSLRVTLVFRRNRGQWQLAHRHADPLANGIGLEEAGRIARPDHV
jgi:ketosteroid isomerase-like protein